MAIGASLFKRKTDRPDGYVWIGLDFGTATTECVVRIERSGTEDDVAIMSFGGEDVSSAQIVLPTAVEIHENNIVPSYEISGRGRVIELLKTRLIAEIDCGLDDERLRRPSGPYACSVIHLASVLKVVRSAVASWSGNSKLKYYMNIAVPVGADPGLPRDARLRTVFREIGSRALEMSDHWPQGRCPLDLAGRLYHEVLAAQIPHVLSSPVVAVPEALAAVTSFLHAPDRMAGNYATVDIGGGTTDISFFWFQTGQFDPEHSRKAWYYAVRSVPVGTNDILAQNIVADEEHVFATAHQRMQQRADTWLEQINQEALNGLLFGLDASYSTAFKQAFTLRPIHREWCDDLTARWTLLLLGGGSGLPLIRNHLANCLPRRCNVEQHGHVTTLSIPSQTQLLFPTGNTLDLHDSSIWGSAKDLISNQGHLLTVAYGLAFRTPDIPKYGLEVATKRPSGPPTWEPPPHTVHN